MFLHLFRGKPKIRDHDYVTLHLDKSEPRQVKKKGTKCKSADATQTWKRDESTPVLCFTRKVKAVKSYASLKSKELHLTSEKPPSPLGYEPRPEDKTK